MKHLTKPFITVTGLRLFTQHLLFIILTFCGRAGIHLCHALPCFSCPYVTGCGGACYLMALQGSWWGLGMPLAHLTTVMGLKALGQLGLFIILALVLNKFWCGWICPFGLVQDWLTLLRKGIGIREARFSWLTRDRLKPVKTILLVYLAAIPLMIAHAGLHPDFRLPFCQICPAKPLMPLFAGNASHLALNFTNTITLVFSGLSLAIAGAMLAGMFFKERFFCYFCPMLVLIHLVRKISPVRFHKRVEGCLGCGNCQRACPMDIRAVHQEKIRREVISEDCILCMTCTESCPQDEVLEVCFFKWRLFASSRAYLARRFTSGTGQRLLFPHSGAPIDNTNGTDNDTCKQ